MAVNRLRPDAPLLAGLDAALTAAMLKETARSSGFLGVPMVSGHGFPAAGSERRRLRAADEDREHVAEVLNKAYVEGRLSKDEYDTRLENALSARTYGDLDQIVTDLPAPMPPMVPVASPVSRVNGLAIASLGCGLGQFVFGPLATIPAIVLGHVARRQIRRTGEQGAGLALAGLTLGWVAVVLGVLLAVVAVAVVSHSQGGPP